MSRDKPASERAPLCPICGQRHWGREPHVFTKAATRGPFKKGAKKK